MLVDCDFCIKVRRFFAQINNVNTPVNVSHVETESKSLVVQILGSGPVNHTEQSVAASAEKVCDQTVKEIILSVYSTDYTKGYPKHFVWCVNKSFSPRRLLSCFIKSTFFSNLDIFSDTWGKNITIMCNRAKNKYIFLFMLYFGICILIKKWLRFCAAYLSKGLLLQ